MNIVVAWLVATLLAEGQAPIAVPRDTDLETLAQWLTGEYTTSEQAESDRRANAAYRHDDVVLLIAPASVPGLPVPADARVLYLEQAVTGGEAAPYRQRVFAVFRAVDGALTTRTYRIASPGDLVGAARDRVRLERLRADRLTPEPGCDVAWTKVDQALYVGGGGRESALRVGQPRRDVRDDAEQRDGRRADRAGSGIR